MMKLNMKSVKVTYDGNVYYIEDKKMYKGMRLFAFEDPEMTRVAKLNGLTLLLTFVEVVK
jgi:hypothetical protein